MTEAAAPPPRRRLLTPLARRRLRNFRRNGRAFWSLILFCVIFGLSLFAEFIANDRPILVSYRGEWRVPVVSFYSEAAFGGTYRTEAAYREAPVQCLIATGGLEDCFYEPEETIAAAKAGALDGNPSYDPGWMIWPLIPYNYTTIVDRPGAAPLPPGGDNYLGTDDTKRDVLARVIYGVRLSVFFALVVTVASSILGVVAGAVQGFFGGWVDLIFQRFIEIWAGIPSLYVIIILFAIIGRSFWLLVVLTVLFGWTALVGVVRAEFLRARNFEYVRAARALGVSNTVLMFRHLLPNAMVATLTMLPFLVTGAIGTLAGLDFLGYGLPSSAPSLGELSMQAKQNLQAPWLGLTAFFVFAILLALLVFIFEGIRDAFDPRKTFA